MNRSFKSGDTVVIHKTDLAVRFPFTWTISMDTFDGKTTRITKGCGSSSGVSYWQVEIDGEMHGWHPGYLTLTDKFQPGDTVVIHKTYTASSVQNSWLSDMDRYEGKTYRIQKLSHSGCYWELEGEPDYCWHQDFLTLVPTQEEKMMVIDTDVFASSEVKPTPEPAFDFDAYYGVKK